MIRMFLAILLGPLVLVTAATEAQAQRAPDMATLDRHDGISKFGIDLGLTFLDRSDNPVIRALQPYSSALRLEPYGQFVTQSGFGFYGALPITRSLGSDGPAPIPQDATALGNLELGLLFVVTNSPTVSWVFRAGIAVPTAADDFEGSLTNYVGIWPRLTDLALTAPDSIYGRLSFSPLFHFNNFFLRFDLGLDIGEDDDDVANELVRINAGAGYDFGTVAASVELVNIATLDDFGDDEDFLHTLAFTLRFMGKQLQPFLSFGMPIDDSRRDQVSFWVAGGLVIAP